MIRGTLPVSVSAVIGVIYRAAATAWRVRGIRSVARAGVARL
jgi:hypothetical protein